MDFSVISLYNNAEQTGSFRRKDGTDILWVSVPYRKQWHMTAEKWNS